MDSWHSYPKVWNLGHNAVKEILFDDVLVEEKIDGSQFSFGLFEDGLRVRSRGAVMHIDAPEKMFNKAVETVKAKQHMLVPGWTYRAEYLAKPKHNALAYDRVPVNNLIIFDINTGEEKYISYDAKADEAHRLGLEVVPRLHYGKVESIAEFRVFLNTLSILGGQKIEGVVVKNYNRFGPDKKALMGKFVSEEFKETHSKTWKADNPTSKDIVERIIEDYASQARWQKSLQHLREAGKIEDSPRDIGLLMKEVWPDIRSECESEIKQKLFDWAEGHIRRGVTRGLPQWYKELLLKKQFDV